MPRKVRTPPYGPVRGMLQGVELLRKSSPSVVDEQLFKQHGIAPGNEYKAIGALRFLGLIDEAGQPTERARLLKTRGAAYTLNLQKVIREAYSELFEALDVRAASRDDIHNFFVTEAGLGAEMATKATRFLIELCKMAEMPIAQGQPSPRPVENRRAVVTAPPAASSAPAAPAATPPISFGWPVMVGMLPPVVIALTPEVAQLSEDELTELLAKVQRAARRAMERA